MATETLSFVNSDSFQKPDEILRYFLTATTNIVSPSEIRLMIELTREMNG